MLQRNVNTDHSSPFVSPSFVSCFMEFVLNHEKIQPNDDANYKRIIVIVGMSFPKKKKKQGISNLIRVRSSSRVFLYHQWFLYDSIQTSHWPISAGRTVTFATRDTNVLAKLCVCVFFAVLFQAHRFRYLVRKHRVLFPRLDSNKHSIDSNNNKDQRRLLIIESKSAIVVVWFVYRLAGHSAASHTQRQWWMSPTCDGDRFVGLCACERWMCAWHRPRGSINYDKMKRRRKLFDSALCLSFGLRFVCSPLWVAVIESGPEQWR